MGTRSSIPTAVKETGPHGRKLPRDDSAFFTDPDHRKMFRYRYLISYILYLIFSPAVDKPVENVENSCIKQSVQISFPQLCQPPICHREERSDVAISCFTDQSENFGDRHVASLLAMTRFFVKLISFQAFF